MNKQMRHPANMKARQLYREIYGNASVSCGVAKKRAAFFRGFAGGRRSKQLTRIFRAALNFVRTKERNF